jgi:hypothetical protein
MAKRGLWEVHHDPFDLSRVWVRYPEGGVPDSAVDLYRDGGSPLC